MKVSYKSSGVNITEAEKFVEKIKPLVKTTFSRNVINGIGNFGALFKMDLKKFSDPVLVSSIDGVGTKIKIAARLEKFDTIGEDLVNHCVNDIAVCGAVPQYFLDYYAVGKLKSADAIEVVKGMVRGCKINKCSLIGGETAEMPGVYRVNDFDLAGAIVGVVNKDCVVSSKNVKQGNILIGLRSNGLHTNGYSLVRKIFNSKLILEKYYPELSGSLGRELLRVHRSYLQIIQSSLYKFKINSISHITGGGIMGNTRRVVPEKLKINIDWSSWQRPFVFQLIQKKGNVSENDMRRTFNLGIGLIFIVSKSTGGDFIKFLKMKNEDPVVIGSIS